MGINISRLPLTVFEICNEFFTAMGAGLPGIVVLMNHGIRTNRIMGTAFVGSVTAASMLLVYSTEEFDTAAKEKVVVITGCDSGLGFSLAEHCEEMGFTVLAGFLSLASEGAKMLCNKRRSSIRGFELDITDSDSIARAVKVIKNVMEEDIDNELWAVVNNAGVMVFGEYEWQTDVLVQQQINVNLLGTMKFTHSLCPLLRKYKARLINVSSHCAKCSLPGLAVYGATKSGILGFTDALRIELSKYGVKVITFIPGSFTTQSNILSKQMDHAYEMRSSFSKEQEDFYGPYFIKYNSYLSMISVPTTPKKISDPGIYQKFSKAVLSRTPKAHYTVEPLQYKIYHALFKIAPTPLRDYLVEQFMQMPKYKPSWEDFEISYSTPNSKCDSELE